MTPRRVLLTGATGYVGGRVLSRLEERSIPVRCLVRRPDHLRDRVSPLVEVVAGDVLDARSLDRAMKDVDVAYYLVHSMGGGHDFVTRDRSAAETFGAAARRNGIRRIIYLGGLGHGELSIHLASRQDVGRTLAASGVPVVEFRAGIIIGSGSISFEMIRALVERLPVMITPRWVATRTQPIAVDDVLDYLVAARDLDAAGSVIYEIGGADQASYGDLMQEYAALRGLKRFMISVPVLTPHLSSLWLGLITPVYANIGRELVDGLRNETVVRDDRARRDFTIQPRSIREAILRATRNEDREFAQTRWSDALSRSPADSAFGGVRFGSRLVDSRSVRVPLAPEAVFRSIEAIGGTTGWYHADFLWRLRGFLDLLAGGAGMRRGRRDPVRLRPGDTVDFWRVETIEPARLLRLRAEMKLPGRAWLQFEVTPDVKGSILRQTALFDSRGLLGLAYWYGIYPIHHFVFSGMLKGIARAATKRLEASEFAAGAD